MSVCILNEEEFTGKGAGTDCDAELRLSFKFCLKGQEANRLSSAAVGIPSGPSSTRSGGNLNLNTRHTGAEGQMKALTFVFFKIQAVSISALPFS